jgi:HSP20 family molecular chaperone IbpA
MQRVTYDLMLDRVRELYLALTGAPLPPLSERQPEPVRTIEDSQVLRRFGELEAFSRLVPELTQRVPQFGFVPPVEVIDVDGELVVEVSASGVAREEVSVELAANMLVVSGVRRDGNRGRRMISELPRGPFRRVLMLPEEVTAEPEVDVVDGLVRITLRKASVGGTKAQA